MPPTARDAYLETQILTATPQRLRLMLIEGAIRKLTSAQAAYDGGDWERAWTELGHCRDIVTELIAGIEPDQTAVAKQILGVYMFVYSSIVEAQFGRDAARLPAIVRILEEERQTWRAVCEKMPERPAAAASDSHASEELAPQRVAESSFSSYSPAFGGSHRRESAFSLDA
jgi:flagellar protein FliS